MAKVILEQIGQSREQFLSDELFRRQQDQMARLNGALQQKRDEVRAGWGEKYHDRVRRKGKLPSWDRLELLKDPDVAGAAIYVCGVSDWQWKTDDLWPELAQILAQQATPIYRLTDSTPPDEEAMWAEVLETLDRIILKLGEKL